jgi:HD superfamily phosphodiesterase
MDILTKTTKAIAAYLHDFLASVKVQRNYLPLVDAETLQALGMPLIFVVPISSKLENLSRAANNHIYAIDITIAAKLHNRNDEIEQQVLEIDQYIELSEKIFNQFFLSVKIGENDQRIICNKPEMLVLVDMDLLEEENCFFSVIRINVETQTCNETKN